MKEAKERPNSAPGYPKVGELAPDFTFTALDGADISLSDYRGRRVVVFMWASW